MLSIQTHTVLVSGLLFQCVDVFTIFVLFVQDSNGVVMKPFTSYHLAHYFFFLFYFLGCRITYQQYLIILVPMWLWMEVLSIWGYGTQQVLGASHLSFHGPETAF